MRNETEYVKEVQAIIINSFALLGMDTPANISDITEFVCNDVLDAADKDNWNNVDVVIGLRRFIESVSE